ncbi:MAG: porin, partial [Prosthecobacter sp.]|nr:porin [Prosthecobacter sp.]
GFFLNGMIGRDAIVSNAYGMGTWLSSPDFGVDLTQAYLQLGFGPSFFIDAGKFTTLNGAEVIAPISDTNFGRSILFGFAGPFTATGARATWQANEKLKLIAGLNDGWDTIRDWSRGVTAELNATYIFNPVFTLGLTGYSGQQRAVDRTDVGPTSNRTLIDVLATFTLTPKLSVLVNYDYAWQRIAGLPDDTLGRANWNGVAAYLNYAWTDAWRTSLRGEFFNDEDGYRTGVAQKWKEVTFTVAYVPQNNKNLEIRGETRRDFSNVASFSDKSRNGFLSDGSRNYNQSFALEVFYKFG